MTTLATTGRGHRDADTQKKSEVRGLRTSETLHTRNVPGSAPRKIVPTNSGSTELFAGLQARFG